MSFVDGVDYQEQQHFTIKQLQAIAPLNVYCYLCLWAYGTSKQVQRGVYW